MMDAALLVAIVCVAGGLALAASALWRAASANGGPGAGPCIYPFLTGMVLAIAGIAVLVGQWLGRLIG